MRLGERIQIRAAPEEVWAYIGDPEQWLRFHPKVARVARQTGFGPAVDAWYEIDFEMGGRRLTHRARVTVLEPLRRLSLEATCRGPSERDPREIRVDTAYTLKPNPGAVEVRLPTS